MALRGLRGDPADLAQRSLPAMQGAGIPLALPQGLSALRARGQRPRARQVQSVRPQDPRLPAGRLVLRLNFVGQANSSEGDAWRADFRRRNAEGRCRCCSREVPIGKGGRCRLCRSAREEGGVTDTFCTECLLPTRHGEVCGNCRSFKHNNPTALCVGSGRRTVVGRRSRCRRCIVAATMRASEQAVAIEPMGVPLFFGGIWLFRPANVPRTPPKPALPGGNGSAPQLGAVHHPGQLKLLPADLRRARWQTHQD